MEDFDKDEWLSDSDPQEIEEDDRLGSDGKFGSLLVSLDRAQQYLRDVKQELERLSNLPMPKDSLTNRIFTRLGF
jgi:hypothetical protein